MKFTISIETIAGTILSHSENHADSPEALKRFERVSKAVVALVKATSPGCLPASANKRWTLFAASDLTDGKIRMIKCMREMTGLGLKEAKELLEASAAHGTPIVKGLSDHQQKRWMQKMEQCGCSEFARWE